LKLLIILSIIFAVLIIYLIICYAIYRKCFYCKKSNTEKSCFKIPKSPQYEPIKDRMIQYVSELLSKPYEQIYIKNKDNKILAARLYKTSPDAPFDLCFHGWRGNSLRDFCGGARISIKMGHNLILVDQRGQGQSFGSTMTFGIKEKYDVKDWCDWVVSEFSPAEINLIGVSMGAASVLMASGLDLPSEVKHIVADCPYSSAIEIIKKVCEVDMKIPAKPFCPLFISSAAIFGHFNLIQKNSSAEIAVKNTKIPILIIHGDEDLFVPDYMSKKIYDSNPDLIKREVFPGAGHGLSYMIDTPRYENIVESFMKSGS